MRSRYTDEVRVLEFKGPSIWTSFNRIDWSSTGSACPWNFGPARSPFVWCPATTERPTRYRSWTPVSSCAYRSRTQESWWPTANYSETRLPCTLTFTAVSRSLLCRKESTVTMRTIWSKGTFRHNWSWRSSAALPTEETIRDRRSTFNRTTNFLALYVNGQSYPAKPLQPNYVEAYRTLTAFVDMELLLSKGCHHRRLSVDLLTQNLFPIGSKSKIIALSTTYLVLMKNVRDASQIATLGRQLYPGRSNLLTEAYVDSTSTS